METKIWLIITSIIVLIAGIAIAILTLQLKQSKLALADQEIINASLKVELIKAHASIDEQNARIEAHKKDIEQSIFDNAADQARISKRYEQLLLEAQKKQGADMSCENTLNLVDEALRGFMYE